MAAIRQISGTGTYIRGLSTSKHGSPKAAAKKAADHGLSHVAIMAVWQDIQDGKFRHLRGNLRRDKLLPYIDAFKARDIDVGLWFYPWGGHEDRLLDDLRETVEKSQAIDFLLDDGELGHKYKNRTRGNANDVGTMRGGQREAFTGTSARGSKAARIEQVTKLYTGLRGIVDENGLELGIGTTAYGMARYHPTFPWETKLALTDWFSPQLYTASASQIDAGIEQWYERAGELGLPEIQRRPLIASVGTFGKKSETKMDDHLGEFINGQEGVDGFLAWSWRQTSRREWRVLAKWAEFLDRGACVL